MEKPFILVKYFTPNTYHRAYETIEEATSFTDHSDDFPGKFVCLYNLETEKFIQYERISVAGIDKTINEIINYYK